MFSLLQVQPWSPASPALETRPPADLHSRAAANRLPLIQCPVKVCFFFNLISYSFFKLSLFIHFWLCWVLTVVRGFSSWGEQGCSPAAGAGFSLASFTGCGAHSRAWGMWAPGKWARGLRGRGV